MSRFITLLFLVLFSINGIAANLVNVTLNDETYTIVDVHLNENIKLIGGVEVFIHEGEYMLPLYAITDALGMDVSINNEDSEFSLGFNADKTQINFASNLIDSTVEFGNANVAWGSNGFDIYVPIFFFESLINGDVNANISNLLLNITSLDKESLYPIELKLQREANLSERRIRERNSVDVNLRDVFIEDQYRLIMPPNLYANIRYSVREEVDLSNTLLTEDRVYNDSTSIVLAGTSDLLYHSSRYAINWQSETDVQSTINFTKYKTSPYDVLPGNVDYYSFGDVRSYASSLTGLDNGVGLAFSQIDDRYSNEFGQTTIDGIASPGWQVELYDGGYFIGETIVNDDGQFIFNDVSTRYGVNQYRIVLYGPFGETETRYETIRIGSNWLNAGEISYRGAALDSDKKLLHSNQDNSGYEIDTVNFGFDYGLTNSTQLQLMYHQSENLEGNVDRYLSTQAQVNFSNNAISLGLAGKENAGYAAEFKVLGQLNNLDSYGFNLQFANDYDLISGAQEKPNWQVSGSYHTEFDLFGKKSIDLYSNSSVIEGLYENSINRARASWGMFGMSMRFDLVNNYFKYNANTQPATSVTSAILSGAGNIGDGRLTLSTTQQLENTNYGKYEVRYQNSFDELLLYTDAAYTQTTLNTEVFDVGAQLAYKTKHFFLNTAVDYNSETQWQFSVGLDFSFGYDYQRNQLSFTSSYNQAAMVDVGAFLDRNDNFILDRGDYALEGVTFSPFNSWAKLPTLKNGRTLLTQTPVKNVVNIDGKWRDVVRPSQGRHTLYTHPGGLVSANIPFTITTSMAGYVLFNDNGELIGANGIRVNLIDSVKNKILDSAVVDEDGFFEFYNQKAGHYLIEVEIDDVSKRGLTVSHRRYDFKTPPRGGYVELEPFILNYGTEQNDKTMLVELNDGNYEPLFSGDENDKEIYVNVAGENGTSEGNTIFNSTFKQTSTGAIKRTRIKLTPDVPITDVVPNLDVNSGNNDVTSEIASDVIDNSLGTQTTVAEGTNNIQVSANAITSPELVNAEAKFTRLEWRYGAQIAVFSSEASAEKYIESLDVKGIPIKAYFDEDNKLYRLILGDLTKNLNEVEASIGRYKPILTGTDMFAKYFRVLIDY